jgi:hypothetical protein
VPGSCSSDQLIQVSLAKYLDQLQTESSEGNFAALFFLFIIFSHLHVVHLCRPQVTVMRRIE